MHSDASIGVRHYGSDVWSLALGGEHDLATAQRVNAVLEDLFEQGTRIILDLSEASFIDSTVIHLIARGLRHAEEIEDDRFLIVSPEDSQPRRILDLVRLEEEGLPVFANVDSALAELGVETTPDSEWGATRKVDPPGHPGGSAQTGHQPPDAPQAP